MKYYADVSIELWLNLGKLSVQFLLNLHFLHYRY